MTRELRYAFRALRREPTFVAGVVATFALVVGTNAAMLGVVTRLMLAPPPGIKEPERVVRVQLERANSKGESFSMSTTSYPTFRALAAVSQAFAATAAVAGDTVGVGRGADLERVASVQASGDYFTVLGTRPALGRFFGPSDDELPAGNAVVVLSHAYWTRRFFGERNVIGRELLIDEQRFTVVGVAPRGFNGDGLSAVDLFLPLTAARRNSGTDWLSNEGMNVVSIVARLVPGVTPAVAGEMASAVLRGRPGGPSGTRASAKLESVVPGASSRESAQAKIALWLSGVSLIVLLIATANVGTLLLLRAERRRRDLAVRVALGAAHRDLARQLVIESVLLAVLGAAAGLLLSRWFGSLLRVTLLPNLAADDGFVDGRVLLVSVAVATVAGVLAGLSPLIHIGRRNVSLELRAAAGTGSARRGGFQNILIGVQVALCTVLLVGAGLFVRSLQRVQSQDLGFSTAGLLYVSLDFRGFVPGLERGFAYEDAVRRVRTLGGVTRASVVQAMPFGNHHVPPISIPGWDAPEPWVAQLPMLYGATPDYLAMMSVKLREGRLFTERDELRSPLVVLVNETMARTVWPGQSPLGKCVRAGFGTFPPPENSNPAESAPCREVVGVVRDSRARSLRPERNEDKLMQYYVPFAQLPAPPFGDGPNIAGLLVQVTGDVDRAATTVQRAIQSASTVPVYANVRAYQDLIDPQLRSWRLGAVLFSAFSALALGIAAVGLFGVISYVVTQRTREIGVRLALGAPREAMWHMVLRDAVRLVLAGIVVGAIAAMAAGPLVRQMLFRTSPWEPANLATALLVLIGVTVAAAVWPAWRAGRVDPLVALRADG